MRDVDDLLRSLGTPPAPRPAPAWPRRRWRVWVPVLALAAAALLVLWARPEPALRGTVEEAPALDLRMVLERGGVPMRVGREVRAGERVLFRAAADRPMRARLWVEGPRGAETIATVELSATPRDVGDERGLVGYRFDGAGRYVFHLSPETGACGVCPTVPVEVR